MHNMDLNNRSLNGGFIKKSKDQFLREAAAEIGELQGQLKLLQEQAKAGYEQITKLEWERDCARLALTAVGIKYDITKEQMLEIYNAHVKLVEAEFLARNEEQKKQFIADIKAGKKIEFTATPNPGTVN